MNEVNPNDIREFYNKVPEIWAKNDLWHLWSRSQIQKYLDKTHFSQKSVILNAGSGGNSYNISCKKMIHLDIAEQKLKGIENAVVGSLEKMPFQSNTFDGIVCVGSVINYCDAAAAIADMSRVAKRGAILILEFESSAGFEYRSCTEYGQSAVVVTVQFQGSAHTQWLYSLLHIKLLLKAYSFSIQDIFPYHICSSLALSFNKDENRSYKMARFDMFVRKIKPLASHANNYIIRCEKL